MVHVDGTLCDSYTSRLLVTLCDRYRRKTVLVVHVDDTLCDRCRRKTVLVVHVDGTLCDSYTPRLLVPMT